MKHKGKKTGLRKIPLYIFTVLFLLLSFMKIQASNAEPVKQLPKNEEVAIGTGIISRGNIAAARADAISQALMKGVEQYLVRRLGSQGMANHFQRLIREVIPKSPEKVQNFHIMAEQRLDNTFKVLVRLQINEEVMEQDLMEAGFLLPSGPPISVLFLVSQSQDGKMEYWWEDPVAHSHLSLTELALTNGFQKMGFSPINRTLSAPDTEYDSELRSPELSDSGVLEWGRLFSAEVVISGRTEIVPEKEVSMTLRALHVRTGTFMTQVSQVEPIAKGPEGVEPLIKTLNRLVNGLAGRMGPTIIQAASSEPSRVRRLEVTLNNLKSYQQIKIFRDFLEKDVAGVQSVKQTRMKRNAVSMRVEVEGDPQRFLDRVLNHENLPFPLTLRKFQEDEIWLDLQ